MKKLEEFHKKTISYEELINLYENLSYVDICRLIDEFEEQNLLTAMKKSGTNGRKPILYKKYKILKKEEDFSEELEEIRSLSASLSINYYINKPKEYKKNREYIQGINSYFINFGDRLQTPMSINERSFDIWGEEKYLRKYSTVTMINNLGISLEKLNVYNTPEPFFFYINDRGLNSVLIIENKDTWFTLRRILAENSGGCLKQSIGLLVYGEGKKILSSIDYLNHKDLEFLKNPIINYWGDIDFEGINIYFLLKKKVEVNLFTKGYKLMLSKVNDITLLRDMKENQKMVSDLNPFLAYFDSNDREKINNVLKNNKYIPQEIANYKILMEANH